MTAPIRPEETRSATAADFDPDGALSRDFLLRRGRCCEEGCRNCPYGFGAGNGGPEVGPEDNSSR